MEVIVGREKEIADLEQYVASDHAEFIAIYGRRRVGKTFLVNQLFAGRLAFSMTGIIGGTAAEQFDVFCEALEFAGHVMKSQPKTWLKAFAELRKFLQPKVGKGAPVIVFLDEIPSLDTHGSDFSRALGHFWNSWASLQSSLKLIVCGSATTWMIRNIIDDKGGLHNRITHEMALSQFSLHETELYLQSRGFNWKRLMILQTYMALGGVAYYLSLLRPEESLAENLDRLYFSPSGELRREFSRLFKTLFKSPEPYMKIVQLLAENKKGLTRQEISNKLNASGRTLTEWLENLQNCEFIRLYHTRGKKVNVNGGIYQLVDFFSMFHLHFSVKALGEENYWTNHCGLPEMNSWLGLTFERVCLAHLHQIKNVMHIDRIASKAYSWRSKASNGNGAQIDMIVERADDIIHLFEIKYSKSEYVLTKAEMDKIENRITAFERETGTRCAIYLTMITTFGLAKGVYSHDIKDQLTLDDLIAC